MALTSPRFAGNARLENAARNRPPLRRGDTGQPVRLIQQALIDLGYPLPISTRKYNSPDGVYGGETKTKVRAFQRRVHLNPDGEVGRNTMARLDALLPGAGAPLVPLPAGGTWDHRIRVHFRSIAAPAVPEMVALRNARRVYGQYDIRVEMASGETLALDPSEEVMLDAVEGACSWDQVNDEQNVLHGMGSMAGVGPNDIVVYYVNRIIKPNGSPLAGCASHTPVRPAVMVSSIGSPWTMAHEIGHVLLGSAFVPVHSGDNTNLMFAPSANITADPPGLTPAQLTAIRASRMCVPVRH